MSVQWTCIAKNGGGAGVAINDLGIVIPAAGQVTLSDYFDYQEIADSFNLRDLVTAETLVINNGTADLSAANGLKWITQDNLYNLANELSNYSLATHDHDFDYAPLSHNHDDRYYTETELDNGQLDNRYYTETELDSGQLDNRYYTETEIGTMLGDYYTKTNLQTSGQAQVHWDNITNAPSFGSPTWVDPVEYRVLDITATAPGSANEGDVYVDTDDNHYYKYVSSSWVDQGAATTGDRVINLADATETIYTFGGSTWTDSNLPDTDNTATLVNDDGDGAEAQYVWDSTSGSWTKIGDVSFGPHLDGGSSKHDASEIDVEGTYSNIPGTPTDLESTLSAIDTALGTANETLDEAYDVGGAGAGRVITADAGAVKIDTASATNAPLELTNKSSAPSTGLAAGQLAVVNNVLYLYDGVRVKWLSVARHSIVFGKDGRCLDQFLKLPGGQYSNLGGYRMKQNATIVAMAAQLSASGTGDFQVQKNGGGSAIATLSVSAATGNDANDTNIDISADDYLQAYESGAANVNNPTFTVEIAWRP